MKIEILGAGCPKCNHTAENVRQALQELNRAAEVVKVTDIKAMIAKGIMLTPGLIIDGKMVYQGKIPSVEQIKEYIQKKGGS